MNDRTRTPRRTSIVPLSIVAGLAGLAGPALAQEASAPTTLSVEVAEIPGRFLFDGPTFDDGMPGYGATFLTQGWLYPAGTLDGEHGADDGALGESFERTIVGASGAFGSVRGSVRQTLVAMTDEMLIRYRFELPLPAAR